MHDLLIFYFYKAGGFTDGFVRAAENKEGHSLRQGGGLATTTL